MSLKKGIRDRIAEVVEDVDMPAETSVVEGWSDYAGRVVNSLKGLAA
jgi:hypothetical protein